MKIQNYEYKMRNRAALCKTKPTGQTPLEPPAHPSACPHAACIHMGVMLSTVTCVTLYRHFVQLVSCLPIKF